MKKKVLVLSIFLISLLSGGALFAQDEKYGDDPERCRIELSTYSEYFNQKNYEDAYPSWSWCFNNCPEATRNIYVQGATLMEYFINKETDQARKEAFTDTLMMVFDRRIEYFGQRANVLGRKAVAVLRYRPQDIKEAYNILKESFELGKEDTELYVSEFYMSSTVVMYNSGDLTSENVVENFSDITDLLSLQLANETDDAKKLKIIETTRKVEEVFVASGVADCDLIIQLYTPKFEASPNDVELAKKILMLLESNRTDECKLSDLYLNVATLLYNNEKSANSAHSIAQAYLKRKEVANSEKFYNEAISLETDPLKKADMYYELGLLYYSMSNDYPRARTAARNAVMNNPNHGRAYLLIGRVYAAGGRNCGETPFERKVLNCLVVDQFIKARNADSSVAAEANELIGRYSANFPTTDELFWLDLEVGSPYTIGCWINETTTIRVSN